MKEDKPVEVCAKLVQKLGLGQGLGCQLVKGHCGRCRNDRSNLPGAKPTKAQRKSYGPVFLKERNGDYIPF
jgi:hypothetical protein